MDVFMEMSLLWWLDKESKETSIILWIDSETRTQMLLNLFRATFSISSRLLWVQRFIQKSKEKEKSLLEISKVMIILLWDRLCCLCIPILLWPRFISLMETLIIPKNKSLFNPWESIVKTSNWLGILKDLSMRTVSLERIIWSNKELMPIGIITNLRCLRYRTRARFNLRFILKEFFLFNNLSRLMFSRLDK